MAVCKVLKVVVTALFDAVQEAIHKMQGVNSYLKSDNSYLKSHYSYLKNDFFYLKLRKSGAFIKYYSISFVVSILPVNTEVIFRAEYILLLYLLPRIISVALSFTKRVNTVLLPCHQPL